MGFPEHRPRSARELLSVLIAAQQLGKIIDAAFPAAVGEFVQSQHCAADRHPTAGGQSKRPVGGFKLGIDGVATFTVGPAVQIRLPAH